MVSTQSEEFKKCQYVTKVESIYNKIENVFSPTISHDLKEQEKSFMERNEKGYYCCKIINSELYEDMLLAYNQYCNSDMLK